MSQRVQQVESLLKRTIAEVFMRGLSDPRVRGMVSVTRVDASPDLKQATVYVTILPEEREKLTMAGIVASTRHVQSKLRSKLMMKTVPHLNFKLDSELKKQQEVLGEIATAMRRTEAATETNAEASQDAGAAPGDDALPAADESSETNGA